MNKKKIFDCVKFFLFFSYFTFLLFIQNDFNLYIKYS